MSTMNSKLTFKRGLELKNRIMMAPMTTKMSFYDGVVTTDEINYYALRSGEIGAVITGAANVQNDGKAGRRIERRFRCVHSGLNNWLQPSRKRHQAILQIFHGGRMTDSSVLRVFNQWHRVRLLPKDRMLKRREHWPTTR